MYSMKNNILYFIVCTALAQVHSLDKLREEDKDLVIAEAAIRKTVNSIFSILNLDHVKHKKRFGQFTEIHNFFVTISLQDDDNLKEIARLARVNNIDNNTQFFITQLNEILNEDNKSYGSTEDEYLTAHIEKFIRKLEYLKFKYGFANNDANFGINKEVLNHLNSDDTSQNNTKAEINDMDGDLLKNNEFWSPSASRRIFDGHRESIKRFPFMASVQFFKKFQCGGSIIKSDLVITSASCLQLAWNNRLFRENPAFLSVQVGCNLYEGGDENIPILEVYFHPEYNPKNLRNNLAIMRLVRILKFSRKISRIKKIDFDRDPWPLPSNTPGITIVGWGAKSMSNIVPNVWNNRLAYSVLDFYPLRECQEVYSKEFVNFKNFCAGFLSKGGGACNRDAGGPGVSRGKLFGVVSFGAPTCGAPDAPTVFTKLGYYTKWIENIMEMKIPIGIRPTTERSNWQRYGMNAFTKATETDFKITPFSVPDQLTTIPSVDALRSLDESVLFKEFITTMFGSEEVKEYLDQIESGTDASDEATTRDISRSAIIKPTTVPTTEADIEKHISADYEIPQEQKGSVRMITAIDNFDGLDEKSDEETTTPAVMQPAPSEKMNEEKQVEQNIAKLIGDIDIQDLLASESSEKSSKSIEIIKPKQPKRTKEKVKPKKQNRQEKEKIEKTEKTASESTEYSTGDDNTDDGDDDNDDKSYHDSDDTLQSKFDKKVSTNKVRTVKNVKKVNNVKKKKTEYKDVTFRQNSSDGIFNIFSQNDLLKLFHDALADATQSKQYTRGALDIDY